jgi:hypothetical protein
MIKNAVEFESALRRGRSVLVTEVPAPTANWRSWWIINPSDPPYPTFHLLRWEYHPDYLRDEESLGSAGGRLLTHEELPDVESVIARIQSIARPEQWEYSWKTDCPF